MTEPVTAGPLAALTADPNTVAMLATFADLRNVERARNADVRSNATLIATMMETHERCELQFGVGQSALEHAGRSLAALIEARRHLVDCHAELAKVAQRHGFDWRMAGDNGATLPDEILEPVGVLNASGRSA